MSGIVPGGLGRLPAPDQGQTSTYGTGPYG